MDGLLISPGHVGAPGIFPAASLWWHPQAHLALDFKGGRYMRGGLVLPETSLLTTARSSDINIPNAAGVFQTLGNNTLPRTDRGLYANGQFTNLVARRNPTLAQLTFTSNLTDADGFAGFGNSIRFPGNYPSGSGIGYQSTALTSGATYTISVLVEMEDGNPPVFGGAIPASAANTFYFTLAQSSTVPGPLFYVVEHIFGNVWKVSYTGTAGATPNQTGVLQTSNNQARAFRLLGMNIFSGSIGISALVPGSADTGGATLLASDIRAVQGVRPSNSEPEPFAGWEAAGLDGAFGGKNIVTIDRLNDAAARFITGAGGDANNLTKLIFDTDNRFKLIVRKSGVDEVALQTGAVASTGDKTIEWQAKPGDYGIEATGVAGDTDSDVETLPTGATTLRIGSDFGALTPFNGWLRELQILKVAA